MTFRRKTFSVNNYSVHSQQSAYKYHEGTRGLEARWEAPEIRCGAEQLVGDEIVTGQQWTDAVLCRAVVLQKHNVMKARIVTSEGTNPSS